MTRSAHDIARFLASVCAFVVVAVVVPIGLVAVSAARFGSPHPLGGLGRGSSPSLDEPLRDDAVVDALIRLSLCVVWAAVAVIVVTTVIEVVHCVRHGGLSMPPVRGLGWAQAVARFIAVGLIVVIPWTQATPSVAASMVRTAAVVDIGADTRGARPESAGPTQPIAEQADADQAMTTHVVLPGESVWSIAEGIAGSGPVLPIAEAILDANLGASMGPGQRFTNPAYIEPGWVLQIPGAAGTSTAPAAPGPTAGGARYEVQRGDTLWDIAGDELGDPSRWPEIWETNRDADMGDGRTFDDPSLILPGWQLTVDDGEATGGVGAEPPADEVAEAPVDEVAEPTVEEIAEPTVDEVAEPTVGEVAETTIPPATDAPPAAIVEPSPAVGSPPIPPAATETTNSTATSAPSAPSPAAPIADATTTTSSSEPPVGGRTGSADPVGEETPGSPSPIRLEQAALLAAGILALVAVRRRQRLRAAAPRHRVPDPRPDLVATERRLRAIDAGERALRVDVASRAAAAALVGSGVQIGWVEVTPDGDVDLRLSGPAILPAPWSGEGHAWHLGAEVPVELLAADARQVGMPCVALVQLGVTPAGADLLVDLEACGALAVDDPGGRVDEVIAAIAAGLASSMYAETAHLVAVSLPVSALLGHRNAHSATSVAAGLALARELAGTTIDNERSTFELRSLRTGGEMWEPAVVLLAGTDDTSGVTAPVGGHGLAVVAPAPIAGAGATLANLGDGWRLEGFGTMVELLPVGLPADDLAAVADLLADADRELEPLESPVAAELGWADTGDGAGDDVGADDADSFPSFVGLRHDIVVGLLGAVEVRDAAGGRGRFERSKTVELIAWLATHRERSTRSGARTALWELDVRDATFANVVSEARRAMARMVAPPDGEEWVARTLTDQLPLHPAVVTDADLVRERVEAARLQPPAQAMATLRPAVELIRDMPFAGTSYLWPDAEGITSNLVLLAITATSEYAGHALSLGDIDGVFWATGQGLKVLAGHEELIGLRMRAHAHAGDLAGVRQEWESYERVLVADAWSDGEPAPKLLDLRRELLG